MPIYVYDHVHLRSPDPSKTAQWYNQMFGAKIVRTPQPPGPDRLHLDLGGVMILIAGALPRGEETQEPEKPHYGLDHFGLKVDNLAEAAAELKAKGVEFVIEPRLSPTGVKIAFIRGPEDVRIELVERPG